MNIVYVYGRDWPSEKAGINFATYTSHGLVKADSENQVDLLVAKNTEKDYSQVLQDYFFIEPFPSFKVHMIENETCFSETTKFYIKAFRRLMILAKQKQIDAIITRTVKFLPYLYLIKKLYDVKVFYEAHSFYLDPELKDEYDRKKEYLYQKFTLPRLDGIICHQNILKKLYQKYIPEQRYYVARTGIKEVKKIDKLWENEYIGYIGSLYESKGIKELFYALKKVEDKNLKLLIVGGRDHRLNKYYKLADKLGIEDRVEITGWVSRKEVEYHLKRMKMGIVPIQDTFHNRYLTSPMKIFDYFSYGIPVIGSDLPPVREIITDKGGLFYENGNADELADAINYLNSSPKLFYEYSDYILDRAEKLLWEQRGKKIMEFINDCK
ncbi:glycosyltransferase family 4 protein [Sporohalobacter salinus]|uniref:glycosyltransferase family 4 protein n=1 Tax=Sporohalobacter salinus TaxID=1494606 RepID=UPI00195FCD72|nr:glycosyltransferase family 4 protein [Sporohalobacter salinus]MBM7622954.1 glycosyltransferase involved in cell wall biosynthesis [Sporohalobacter salinus]